MQNGVGIGVANLDSAIFHANGDSLAVAAAFDCGGDGGEQFGGCIELAKNSDLMDFFVFGYGKNAEVVREVDGIFDGAIETEFGL